MEEQRGITESFVFPLILREICLIFCQLACYKVIGYCNSIVLATVFQLF